MRMGKAAAGLGLAAVLLALMLWQAGVFVRGQIGPDDSVSLRVNQPPPTATAEARQAMAAERYEAVGTVRPRTKIQIEAQVSAKISEVHVWPGDSVTRAQTLVTLDSRQLQSQRDQAQQGLESAQANTRSARQNVLSAQAAFGEAKSQYKRIKSLYDEGAVAKSEMDRAEAAYLQAEAGLQRAKDNQAAAEASVRQAQNRLEESMIALSYATIKAPEAGEVVDRLVEPGDLAVPGKPLLELQTSGAMRLEAMVREGVINRVRPGKELEMDITALNRTVTGVVEEIVPVADPRTRTFLVKVGLPDMPGLYSGMFGRLYIGLDPRPTVLIPQLALRRVGQLDTVLVQEADAWRSVYVKAGAERGGEVEILSGLSGGERVGLPEPANGQTNE